MNLVTNDVFRATSLTRLRNDYVFNTTEAIEDISTSNILLEWIVNEELARDRSRPNKLENGSPDLNSWSPACIISESTDERRSVRNASKKPKVATVAVEADDLTTSKEETSSYAAAGSGKIPTRCSW
jgi:hypothetical protein